MYFYAMESDSVIAELRKRGMLDIPEVD